MASYLFEAPPAHLELPDGSYRLAMLDPRAGSILEALSWEDASREHAESPTSIFSAARQWFTSKLRDGFARRLGVGTGGQVHHAIELQVLKRYPGAFSPKELNSFQNMRGIPGEMDPGRFHQRQAQFADEMRRRGIQPDSPEWKAAIRSWQRNVQKGDLRRKQLHNSHIRTWWNRQYTELDEKLKKRPGLVRGSPAWRSYVHDYLTRSRKGLDAVLPGLFSEHRKDMDWSRTGQYAREELKSYVDPLTGIAYRKVDPATGRPYAPFDMAAYLARRRR